MHRKLDQVFKGLLDAAPRGFLHLSGILPLHARARVIPLQREVTRDPLFIDGGYRIRDRAGWRVEHLEAFARFVPADADRMARYGAELAVKHDLPVFSTALLLLPRYNRPELPAVGEYVRGAFCATYPFRLIRLWELPADEVLHIGTPEMLAWLPLLRTDPAGLRRAAARLEPARRTQAAATFDILGELRYGKDVWKQIITKGLSMIPARIWLKETSIGDWVREGVAKGLAKGREESRKRLCSAASAILSRRFPKLAVRSHELDKLSAESLESLVLELATAADQAAAAGLLDAALGPKKATKKRSTRRAPVSKPSRTAAARKR